MRVFSAIGIFAGIVIMGSLITAHFLGQINLKEMSWLWLTFFVGANLFQYGFTKFCPLGLILKKLGVPETR